MNKTIITITILLSFLIIYFLQINFFSWFNLAGVKPNLFVILVLLIGLFSGKSRGVAFGIIIGICLDFFIGRNLGITAIMLAIIGYFGGYLDKNFSKDSRFTIILMVIIATLLYEIGSYFFNFFINGVSINKIFLCKTILIEVFFNIILTIILYPLILKFGYKLEKTYSDKNILTRYF